MLIPFIPFFLANLKRANPGANPALYPASFGNPLSAAYLLFLSGIMPICLGIRFMAQRFCLTKDYCTLSTGKQNVFGI
jgi:hypothetical protein